MKVGWYLLCLVLGVALGLVGAGYYCENSVLPHDKPQVDTLVVRDTIVREKPVYVTRRIVDTAYVVFCDTLLVRDSVLVPVPIEERVYEDSTYRAVISGFRPSLDTISVYQKTIYINNVEKVKVYPRFSLGVQAGWGVSFGDKVQAAPYIGIGGTYNILNFGYYDKRTNH